MITGNFSSTNPADCPRGMLGRADYIDIQEGT